MPAMLTSRAETLIAPKVIVSLPRWPDSLALKVQCLFQIKLFTMPPEADKAPAAPSTREKLNMGYKRLRSLGYKRLYSAKSTTVFDPPTMPKRTTCPAVFSLRRKPGTNRRRQGSSTRSCRRLNELVSPDIGLPYSICCTLPTRSAASRRHATMTSTPAQVGMRESLRPPALFL